MKKLASAILLVVGVFAATPARAEVHGRFLFDAAPGVSIPLADRTYRGEFSASFKLSLRMGGEFWFGAARKVGIAGEVATDFEPLTYSGVDDTHFGRIRALVGLRFLIAFKIGAIWLRAATGLDYIIGSQPGNAYLQSYAYTVEPGFGIQFRITRRGVIGFSAGFPVAFPSFDQRPTFTSIDADLLVFIGARI